MAERLVKEDYPLSSLPTPVVWTTGMQVFDAFIINVGIQQGRQFKAGCHRLGP